MRIFLRHSSFATCTAALLVLGAGAVATLGQSQAPSPGTAGPLPTAEQIVERYVKAIGGRDAIMKITSRHMRGTAELGGPNISATFESFEKAPNKSLVVFDLQGAKVREAFDGKVGWSSDPDGVREHAGAELAETIRDSDFYEDLNLLKRYAKLVVVDRTPVGERATYQLQGSFPDGSSETLYFDVETGMLLRKVTQKPGPDGDRTEYEMFDFKEVDGIKMPFTGTARDKMQQIVMRVVEVKHNVPIEDSLFAKPAAP